MVYPINTTISFGDGDGAKIRAVGRTKTYPTSIKKTRYEIFIQPVDDNFSVFKASNHLYNIIKADINIRFITNKKICIECKTAEIANEILDNPEILVSYKVNIPNRGYETCGRVPIPNDYSEEYIYKNLNIFEKGVAGEDIKILEVRRITNAEKIPVNSVSITFSGNKIPKSTELDRLILPVFYQTNSVLQCKSCWLFGHSTKACRGQKRCENCGNKHHSGSCEMKCINCNGHHLATAKHCPIYQKRKLDELERAKATAIADELPKLSERVVLGKLDFPSLPASKTNIIQNLPMNGDPSSTSITEVIRMDYESSSSLKRKFQPSESITTSDRNQMINDIISAVKSTVIANLSKDPTWASNLVQNDSNNPNSSALKDAIVNKITQIMDQCLHSKKIALSNDKEPHE